MTIATESKRMIHPKPKVRKTPTLRSLVLLDGKPIERHDKRFLRHVPTQARSVVTLNLIVDAAERLLADPTVGRDWFNTSTLLKELHRVDKLANKKAGVTVKTKRSIGTIYRYFEDFVALLDYLWPERPNDVFIPTKELPPVVTDDNEELAASL